MDMFEPGRFGTAVAFKKRYGNFINGEWTAPAGGQYFENLTLVTGKVLYEVPRSTAEDVERALDAAHAAKAAWGRAARARHDRAGAKAAGWFYTVRRGPQQARGPEGEPP